MEVIADFATVWNRRLLLFSAQFELSKSAPQKVQK